MVLRLFLLLARLVYGIASEVGRTKRYLLRFLRARDESSTVLRGS